jgi:hypothetical protein
MINQTVHRITKVIYLGVKWSGHEVGHSRPYSAEIRVSVTIPLSHLCLYGVGGDNVASVMVTRDVCGSCGCIVPVCGFCWPLSIFWRRSFYDTHDIYSSHESIVIIMRDYCSYFSF